MSWIGGAKNRDSLVSRVVVDGAIPSNVGRQNNATMKYRVGLLVTATGKYYETFFGPLLGSIRRYFFPTHDVRVFLFTDQDVDETAYEAGFVQVIRIAHGPWPEATLRRYEYIDENRHVFQSRDYLFWCDADMRFVAKVSEEVLPHTVKSMLTGTLHPGYSSETLADVFIEKYRSERLHRILTLCKNTRYLNRIVTIRYYPYHSRGPYETNEKSTAYVGEDEGDYYYIGAFWGGRTPEVLQMSATLHRNVEQDLSWGHVARWHDESYLNRYFIDHPPEILSPGFCHPERYFMPLVKKRILALPKEHDKYQN